MTKIVIADAHAIVRAGLRALLDEKGRLNVVAEVQDYTAALDAAAKFKADVLLLKPGLKGITLKKLVASVASLDLPTKIIALAESNSRKSADLALTAGVDGYVLMADDPRELFAAIKAVLKGKRYISSRIED